MRQTWFRQNIAAVIVAIIGVMGAFLGAFYGSNSQTELWRKDKAYQYSIDILNKRIDIIRAIVRSNVQAQRVDTLMSVVKAENFAALSKMVLCSGKNADSVACIQDRKSSIDIIAANKEIADLQAEYFANVQLSAIYFCDKTRDAIREINKEREKNWWELDRSLREKLVGAMASELACGLHLDSILK